MEVTKWLQPFGMLTPRPIRNPTQRPHNASVPLQYELH